MSVGQLADWQDLVACALVGLERRSFPPPGAGSAPAPDDALGRSLDAAARSDGLLGAAAVLAAWRRAGFVAPQATSPLAAPAAKDERPGPPPGADAALSTILTNRLYRPLLGEWLALADRSGVRLPPELAPEVLEALARRDPELRPVARRVLGPLGGWLAARNEAWAWAADEPSSAGRAGADSAEPGGAEASPAQHLAERWARTDLGDEDRLHALRLLRRVDRAEAARAVEATWAHDPQSVRMGVMRAVTETLDADDEPFLERALADSWAAVRNGAHQCLASLPASAFAKRMAARVVPLVTLAGVLHNKLVITHPRPLHADEEAALRRDGFEVGPSSRRRTSSPTELPVVHLVGAVPLDAWTTSLGLQPDELVRLAAEMDPPELLYGWARAAARQQRGDWAAALVTTAVVGDDLDGPLLVALLAPSELERRVVALLRAEGPGQRVVALLDHLDAPWPAELSSIVVDVLAGVLEWRIAVTGNGPVGQLLQLAALRLDPALADEAVDRLSGALAAAEAELLATGADGDGHGGAGARSSAAGSPASSAVHVQSPAAGSTGGAATFGIGRRNALTAGIAFWRPRLATMFSLLAFRKSLYHEMSALNMHLQQDGTTGHTA